MITEQRARKIGNYVGCVFLALTGLWVVANVLGW